MKTEKKRTNQKPRKISNSLTNHLKELEKEEQTKPQQKKIKISKEIKEFKKKTLKKIIKTKNSFFERINKIKKLLARLNKKRERVQISKVKNKRINNNQCHRNAKKPPQNIKSIL